MKRISAAAVMVFLTAVLTWNGPALADTDDARETFMKYCTTCHMPSRSLRALKSRENWELTVERMSHQYKMFHDEEIPQPAQEVILEYLLKEAGGD